MASVAARKRKVYIAQFGTIGGGPLDGWSYAYLRHEYVRGKLVMFLACTPQHWPSPKVVGFRRGDLRRLWPARGAKRYELRELIENAREVALARKTR